MAKRTEVTNRYEKILDYAQQRGRITNAQAREVSGFEQAYYHLRQLQRRGLLAHVGYNEWTPTYRQEKRSKASRGWNIHGDPWKQGQPWCPGCGREAPPKSYSDCECLT